MVTLGLMLCDQSGAIVARGWKRVALPRDVEPGESIELLCELTFPEAGSRSLRVDLVSEHLKWFGETPEPIAVIVSRA